MKKLTLDEHLVLADKVRDMVNTLGTTLVDVSHRYGKTSRVSKTIGNTLTKLKHAQAALDSEYHIVATDKDFEKYGNPYYSKVY